jgi:hypothetical protein
VATHGDGMSTPLAKKTAPPEIHSSTAADPRELRAKAARYRTLAEDLHDWRIVAEVRACARELEAEADWLEQQASFGSRIVVHRYCING